MRVVEFYMMALVKNRNTFVVAIIVYCALLEMLPLFGCFKFLQTGNQLRRPPLWYLIKTPSDA